jgi:hypothetical protein
MAQDHSQSEIEIAKVAAGLLMEAWFAKRVREIAHETAFASGAVTT